MMEIALGVAIPLFVVTCILNIALRPAWFNNDAKVDRPDRISSILDDMVGHPERRVSSRDRALRDALGLNVDGESALSPDCIAFWALGSLHTCCLLHYAILNESILDILIVILLPAVLFAIGCSLVLLRIIDRKIFPKAPKDPSIVASRTPGRSVHASVLRHLAAARWFPPSTRSELRTLEGFVVWVVKLVAWAVLWSIYLIALVIAFPFVILPRSRALKSASSNSCRWLAIFIGLLVVAPPVVVLVAVGATVAMVPLFATRLCAHPAIVPTHCSKIRHMTRLAEAISSVLFLTMPKTEDVSYTVASVFCYYSIARCVYNFGVETLRMAEDVAATDSGVRSSVIRAAVCAEDDPSAGTRSLTQTVPTMVRDSDAEVRAHSGNRSSNAQDDVRAHSGNRSSNAQDDVRAHIDKSVRNEAHVVRAALSPKVDSAAYSVPSKQNTYSGEHAGGTLENKSSPSIGRRGVNDGWGASSSCDHAGVHSRCEESHPTANATPCASSPRRDSWYVRQDGVRSEDGHSRGSEGRSSCEDKAQSDDGFMYRELRDSVVSTWGDGTSCPGQGHRPLADNHSDTCGEKIEGCQTLHVGSDRGEEKLKVGDARHGELTGVQEGGHGEYVQRQDGQGEHMAVSAQYGVHVGREGDRDHYGRQEEYVDERQHHGNQREYVDERHHHGRQREYAAERHHHGNQREYVEERHHLGRQGEYVEERHHHGREGEYVDDRHMYGKQGEYVDSRHYHGRQGEYVEERHHHGSQREYVDNKERYGNQGGYVDDREHFGQQGGYLDDMEHYGQQGGYIDDRELYGQHGGYVDDRENYGQQGGYVDDRHHHSGASVRKGVGSHDYAGNSLRGARDSRGQAERRETSHINLEENAAHGSRDGQVPGLESDEDSAEVNVPSRFANYAPPSREIRRDEDLHASYDEEYREHDGYVAGERRCPPRTDTAHIHDVDTGDVTPYSPGDGVDRHELQLGSSSEDPFCFDSRMQCRLSADSYDSPIHAAPAWPIQRMPHTSMAEVRDATISNLDDVMRHLHKSLAEKTTDPRQDIFEITLPHAECNKVVWGFNKHGAHIHDFIERIVGLHIGDRLVGIEGVDVMCMKKAEIQQHWQRAFRHTKEKMTLNFIR